MPLGQRYWEENAVFRIPHHEERHITGGKAIGEAILGSSDGLTVPFALAAGLSGAVTNPGLVFLAGAAEMVAGGIAMGMGGYLSTKSTNQLYESELARERRELKTVPDVERHEVRKILRHQGFEGDDLEKAVQLITVEKERWLRFMMREEIGLTEDEVRPPTRSAIVVGGSYMLGALIPLLPYLFVSTVAQGLLYSATVTLVALFVAGVLKSKVSGRRWFHAGLETMAIGAVAAGAAYALTRLLSAGGLGA